MMFFILDFVFLGFAVWIERMCLHSFQKRKPGGIANKVPRTEVKRINAADAVTLGPSNFCLIFVTTTSVVRAKAFACG